MTIFKQHDAEKQLQLVKRFAELEGWLVNLEELELQKLEKEINYLRRLCQAGYQIIDLLKQEVGMK